MLADQRTGGSDKCVFMTKTVNYFRRIGLVKRRLFRGLQTGTAEIAAPLALGLVGVAFWVLSQGQPARLGGAIGPGFMARGLAVGIVLLALLWGAVIVWRGRDADVVPPARTAQWAAGPALLGGVLAFALLVPVAGLVAGAGLAAGFAAFATGERRAGALAATALLLAGLAAAIGLLLLPPTAPLWPGG